MADPSEKIIESRVIDGKSVDIWELCWPSDEDVLYDIWRTDDQAGTTTLVSTDESFDHLPSDDEIRPLLRDPEYTLLCPTCGASYTDDEADEYVEHRKSSCQDR